jgi:hypothetical protein
MNLFVCGEDENEVSWFRIWKCRPVGKTSTVAAIVYVYDGRWMA